MDAYLFLIASLLPLIVAPWVARLADRSAAATSALDSFVAVAVSGVALLHVLPHAFLEAGLATLPAMAIGFVLPLGLGHSHSPRREKVRSALVLVAFIGLGLHAVLDGLALFAPHDHDHDHAHAADGSLLALAVILHRLPMALAIWWIAAPELGKRVAVGLLTAIGGATILGFAAAGEIWDNLSSPSLAVLQAAIAGMLLHMVLGHHEHRTPEMNAPPARLASTLGVVAGVALIAALDPLQELEQVAGGLSVGATFQALALAFSPALLLAYLGLAWLRGYAPEPLRVWLLVRRHPPSDGQETPTVHCFRQALLSEVQLPVLALSFCLLGGAASGYRLLSVLCVAGLAVLASRNVLAESPIQAVDAEAAARRPSNVSRGRLAVGLRFGFGAEIERTMPWILTGLGIAAFLEPMTDLAAWTALEPPAQIGGMALLGCLGYFLGVGATPILAVLLYKGMAFGPALVFLLAGVAVNGSRRLAATVGSRLAWSFAARMAVLTFVWGYAFSLSVPAPDLREMAAREPSAVAVASAVILLVLTFAALYRQGFRGFMRPSQAVERWHESGL